MCLACSVAGMKRYENVVAEAEEVQERYEGRKGYENKVYTA